MPWGSNQQEYQQQQQHQQQQQQQTPRQQQYSSRQFQQQQQQQQTVQNDYVSSSCVPVAGSSIQANYTQQQLSEEVYRKLRQVDQQPSTLTTVHNRSGNMGFAARILDKREYKVGKGTHDITIVQLVEIIKKPGQSLGLYLREGNGIDRFTGVFASRFGENSELERFGNIIQPGDEILNVNNVEVTGMSIDDVVLMLSIPRRLLLRIKYLKNRRETFSSNISFGISDASQSSDQRPVVVFQKSLSEDHSSRSYQNNNSQSVSSSGHGFNEQAPAGILSKPACTASTWLGKRVRQQQQLKQQQKQQEELHNEHRSSQHNNNSNELLSYSEDLIPNMALLGVGKSAPATRQYYHLAHQPRVLDANGQPIGNNFIPLAQQHQQQLQQQQKMHDLANQNLIRYPLSEQLGNRRRHPAYSSATLGHVPINNNNNPGGISMLNHITSKMSRRPLTTVGVPIASTSSAMQGINKYMPGSVSYGPNNRSIPSGIGIISPNYNINDNRIVRPLTSMSTVQPFLNYQNLNNSKPQQWLPFKEPLSKYSDVEANFYKSNSLPRRRVQSAVNTIPRSVKWRNDLIDENISIMPNVDNSNLNYNNLNLPHNSNTHYSMNILNNQNYINGFIPGNSARTIADIFSAQEYKNWAGNDETMSEIGISTHRSRWFNTIRGNAPSTIRSTSLPSKTILRNNFFSNTKQLQSAIPGMSTSVSGSLPVQDYSYYGNQLANNNNQFPSQLANFDQNQQQFLLNYGNTEKSDILDRLHVSPLMNRKVPLKTAGSGFDVDRLSINSLNGIITISIVEGKNLKVPDRMHSKQLYVVLEINEVHRARTGISVPEQNFYWNESFSIDVQNATDAQFFVYAWHPQLRHRFCHKGSIRLLDAFFVDQLSGNRIFSLNLEPSGSLLIRIGFDDMAQAYSRIFTTKSSNNMFGIALEQLIQQDQSETPVGLTRLIQEIEERGVDTPGLYYLCGATERKLILRKLLENDSRNADLSVGPIPDINLLTCLVKDFLREMPSPLIPSNIYTMLVDAGNVLNVTTDKEGNQKFILRIIDCLQTSNKNTLILVMDHLRNLLAAEPHNGLTANRLSTIFGPLLFCTAAESNLQSTDKMQTQLNITETEKKDYKSAVKVNLLSGVQASQSLKLLLDFWPSRVNSSDSNSSTNTT